MRDRRFWIVIPAQAFDRGKTRLAPVLSAEQRQVVSRRWFRHVVRSARRVAANVLVVSRSAPVLGLARRLGVRALKEQRSGLNPSAHQGARIARRHGASGVLVVHADLPELRPGELATLMRSLARHDGVVLAPDRDCEGTNALAVRSPRPFRYRFGATSFKRHLAESRRQRLRSRALNLPGVSRDVDSPDQYRALASNRES
jgi:2-phospho-L-lactate guanylyltransferase